MATFLSPTKGNLINLKKNLQLSKLGFELMDKKRNILIREMMPLVEVAKTIRNDVEETFKKAYEALKMANLTLGDCENIAELTTIETGISIEYKSVMGIEIPKVTLNSNVTGREYGILNTNSHLDTAYFWFSKAKEISIILAEIENSIYSLSKEIKETKIRANALENIVIPKVEENIKYISDALEEKEREEFSRLKLIKFKKIS